MTKKVGRPRKHEADAVSCLTKVPRALMEQLDQEGVSRQQSVLVAIERGVKCSPEVQRMKQEYERLREELRETQDRMLQLARECLDAGADFVKMRQADDMVQSLRRIQGELEHGKERIE